MGNEMGNNNTSGLREEDNTNVESQKKSFEEGVHAEYVEQNHIVPAAQGKDADGKQTGLASDFPNGVLDPQVDNKASIGKEDNVKAESEKDSLQKTEKEQTELASADPNGVIIAQINYQISKGKEEENTSIDLTEESLQEAAHSDDIKEKDYIVPASQDGDIREKDAKLTSGNGAIDPEVDKETSNGSGKKENEVHPPDESPDEEVKANETRNETSTDILSASLSNYLKNNEKPEESILPENQPETNTHQLNKQTSVKKEDEEARNFTLDTISTSSTPDPQEQAVLKPDPQEFIEAPNNRSVEDATGSSLTSSIQENGYLLDTNLQSSPDEGVVSDPNQETEKVGDELSITEMVSQAENVSSNKSADSKDGDDVRNSSSEITRTVSDLPDGAGIKCNRELPTEMNPISKDSPELQLKASPVDESLNSHMEVSDPEDKCMILGEEVILIAKESENGHHLTQPLEESVGGAEIDGTVVIESEVVKIGSGHENNGIKIVNGSDSSDNKAKIAEERLLVDVPIQQQNSACEELDKNSENGGTKVVENGHLVDGNHNEANKKYCKNSENEEAKVVDPNPLVVVPINSDKGSEKNPEDQETVVLENGHLVDVLVDNQNKESKKKCEVSEGQKSAVVSEFGIASEESSLADCKFEDDEPKEKSIVEEVIQEKEEERDGIEGQKYFMSRSSTVESAEEIQPGSPAPVTCSQDYQQDDSGYPSNNMSSSELKQENSGEIFVPEASTFKPKTLTEETLVPVIELESEKPSDVSHNTEISAEAVAEAKAAASESSGQHKKRKNSGIVSTDGYDLEESMTRLSTESDTDNLNVHPEMRKSPSFGIDLRIEARSEESDQTPLLYQDKAAIESLSSQANGSLNQPIAQTEYEQHSSQYQAMPLHEKVITLETSDSERSPTPFLGFLKEEEEANIVVTTQDQENHFAAEKETKDSFNSRIKEEASTLTKGKEKRRSRPSLFSTCICCATVIN